SPERCCGAAVWKPAAWSWNPSSGACAPPIELGTGPWKSSSSRNREAISGLSLQDSKRERRRRPEGRAAGCGEFSGLAVSMHCRETLDSRFRGNDDRENGSLPLIERQCTLETGVRIAGCRVSASPFKTCSASDNA